MIKSVSLCLVILCAVADMARGEIRLSSVFSDHMVLQCDMAVPVWGVALPGEVFTVMFAGQTKTAIADAAGRWKVVLDPLAASVEPRELRVRAELTSRELTLRDVLVGEVWVGSGQSNMAGEISTYAVKDPGLAAMMTGPPYLKIRQIRAGGVWQVGDVGYINHFSALLFCFGRRLHEELGVPIGLMLGAVGGTPSAQWLSKDAVQNDAACQDLLTKYAQRVDARAMQGYQAALARWEQADAAAKQSNTPSPPRPDPPAKYGGGGGGRIGSLYEQHIRPFIPYAIRGVLWDQGENGVGLDGVDQYTLMGALINGWRKEWGQGAFPFLYVQKPNGGGCAWDDAPVGIPPGQKLDPLPARAPVGGQGIEPYIRMLNYPNTGMVISSDLGGSSHPTNKSGYGHRAGNVALGMVYGSNIEYCGPLYASHAVEGSNVRVHFSHVGTGLVFRHGDRLQGFAVAGANRTFQWADAVIEGDTVVLSSAAVSQPVFVSYAWALDRRWANLFNQDGLPAIPFRTDQ